MSIVYYQPWSVLNGSNPAVLRLANARRAARSTETEWQLAVDICEEAGQFVLRADVPGIEPQAIQVSIDEGVLKIEGSRPEAKEPTGGSYKQRERVHGGFQRSFQMPDNADVSNISASHKHGVLEIAIPKRPEAAPRKIQVTH